MRKKRKNPRSLAALGFSLELLGRFELPTSSLPNILELFSPVLAFCTLLPATPCAARGCGISSCSLLRLVAAQLCRFFLARVGFCVGFFIHNNTPAPAEGAGAGTKSPTVR